MLLSDLLSEVVGVSERSAKLAQAIRSEHALFDLLVEEKIGDSRNKRFVQDFKTLADVLVQEMVRNHLGKKFPGLVEHIYGEESNQFTNVLGETVEVSVQATQQETCKLLERVLDGNQQAAGLLASVVHEEPTPTSDLPSISEQQVDETSLGIWIDPIDSTAQYIHGKASRASSICPQVYEEGLQCVTVLIGVYDLQSGLPVLGVINQPFSKQNTDASWSGRFAWGVAYKDVFLHSDPPSPSSSTPKPTIVMSSSENPAIQDALRSDFTLLDAAGAGYKILCVVNEQVDLYLLTKASTFKWDTCSPQAVLLAQKGGLLDYQKALGVVKTCRELEEEELAERLWKECSVIYNKPDKEGARGGEEWSNTGGIVAYRDIQVAMKMLKKLSE